MSNEMLASRVLGLNFPFWIRLKGAYKAHQDYHSRVDMITYTWCRRLAVTFKGTLTICLILTFLILELNHERSNLTSCLGILLSMSWLVGPTLKSMARYSSTKGAVLQSAIRAVLTTALALSFTVFVVLRDNSNQIGIPYLCWISCAGVIVMVWVSWFFARNEFQQKLVAEVMDL